MKRIIAFLLVLLLCFSFCACGAVVEKNDAGFVTNLSKGLEARWKIVNKTLESTEAAAHRQQLIDGVNAELNVLGNYADYTFTDSTLANLAQQYFTALSKQLEGAAYYGVDDQAYYNTFTVQGYTQRAKLIYQINSLHTITVSEKNATTMSEMLVLGERVAAVEGILNQELVFENTGNECEMLIENTTKFDLSNTQLTFNLYDDDGVLVGNSVVYIENWPANSKYRANAWIDNHDFTKVEMRLEQYSHNIITNFLPVTYKNEMIITIFTPDFPMELNYGYSNRIYTSCSITSMEYEIGYWSDGKAGVTLNFSGTKTYDKEGDSSNNSCMFTYKLLDKDGDVAASGTAYVDPLKVGENFKNETAYVSDLAPGAYTLILEDDMS